MATVNKPTAQNPDPAVSTQYGISGWLDGLANLSLLYGASRIKSKFPEQFQNDQNYDPNYRQDDALNDARYSAQLSGNSGGGNFSNYAFLGVIGLAAVGLLIYAVKK